MRKFVNTRLLKTAVRAWLMEILVSGFNFLVLMNLIYEPIWGKLVAHQIGMSARIVYIFIFAYFLLRYVKEYETKDLIHVGVLWLGLTLIFEWAGSLAIGRPIDEILIGWNILAGYMWPYVLLAYFSSNLIAGVILHPGRSETKNNWKSQTDFVNPQPSFFVDAQRSCLTSWTIGSCSLGKLSRKHGRKHNTHKSLLP